MRHSADSPSRDNSRDRGALGSRSLKVPTDRGKQATSNILLAIGLVVPFGRAADIGRKHMRMQSKTLLASVLAIVMVTAAASAQQAPSPPPTTPYGTPIGLEAAKRVMAAAEAEAVKNNWAMAIVILDSTGHMVMLHKFDNTQYGSLMAAEDKAL